MDDKGPRDLAPHVPDEVQTVLVGEREIVLVGTAHVSRESAELVERVIRERRPDRVCVELDTQRYEALVHKSRWENLDLRQVIRGKQLTTLFANLVLAAYQRRIGDRLGVLPGTELLAAIRVAEECGIPHSLCDREIRITLLRAWRSMSLWERAKLSALLMAGLWETPALGEGELRELRKRDVLNEVMQELSRALPALKRVLIDERDQFLAERIRTAEGRRIVAVVGAGHLEGLRRALEQDEVTDLGDISEVPRATANWSWIGWSIPLLILGSLGIIAWTKGPAVAAGHLGFWTLATGIPSAIGAILALGHPLTVVTAFLVAPFTTLSPLIGAGHVTAFVQAYVRPPLVRDFQQAANDAGSVRQWWKNRVLRVLLAFVFPTLGAIIGTYVGGYDIVSGLF